MRPWICRTIGSAAGVLLAFGAGAVWGQGSTSAANSPGQTQQRSIQMVRAEASLGTTIDAKKAKQGEAVKAKLQENVDIPNQQPLPKNTVLEGHVDQVMPSQHKSDSTVVITFDKAKLKDGKEVPIKATILQVSEPALMQQEAAAGGGPAGAPAGEGAPGGGAPQMGGGAGAPGGGGSAGAAPTPQPMNNSVPSANPAPQQERHSNGVPGVMLTSDIHQQASATFTAKGRNVHVPGGTEMQVALAVIPPGVKIQ